MSTAPCDPPTECPLCGAARECRHRDYPGYRQPRRFSILHCGACNTSMAHPCEIDAELYRMIYRHIEDFDGYNRYSFLAREILRAPDPLAYLAEQESCYWAVARVLDTLRLGPEARVLDVGSGMGYLTYALAKRGFRATGLEISPEAVAAARARYGDHFLCQDARSLGDGLAEPYDLVIATELIEHVIDPAGFLAAVKRLIKPGGAILITTPSRTLYRDDALWHTDLPPHHLWWFSEQSLEVLARRGALSCEFVDFTDYNLTHAHLSSRLNGTAGIRPRMARGFFDAEGRLLPSRRPRRAALKRLLRRLGVLDTLRRAKWRHQARVEAGRRKHLCEAIAANDPEIQRRRTDLAACLRPVERA